MTDDADKQPPLTLSHQSFVRGELEGKPCVVVYDSATDKTSVIAFHSKFYVQALAAFNILEISAKPLPESAKNKKTVIHMPKIPKLILPGSNASN